MDKKISICVVGAGSSYTPELIEGILDNAHDQLPITSICLQDINKERMQVMAGLAERMIRYAKRDITVKYSACLEDMLEGVDYVISQIRVGGMEARFLDESIPLKYGIIGQETTGPGGMFNALRTIPRMIDIANKVESVAPDAYILNYTNPSGIITEAVTKHTKARIIGLCAGIPEIQENIKAKLSDYF
ncbi:MAG: 6-phospho-beta-glucosidase, partial [Kiritimatiellae bacterium]|nr:6-phospho-beta-glucosidase [Kiritimatiellia bacterium]